MRNEEAGAFTIGLILGGLLEAFVLLLGVLAIGTGTVYKFIYDYQGLLGAIIALLGAYGAVWVVLKQIRPADELAAVEREDKRSAARTLMPSALTGVQTYSVDCLRLLKGIPPGPNGNSALQEWAQGRV